ncbi:MAG: DUF4270 domain-containing protein [Tannerella sp.]|jgi:hypothetical protein|nr:DUF4270 domain-containing protein [Tannerella sp.]
MNLKQYIIIALACLGGLALGGCSDDYNMVGAGIQPDGDFITIFSDTFQIKASTIKIDSIYAKTTESLLGEIYDPLYGHLKADYLCQFYCEEGFKFKQTPNDGKIDSMSLYIYYKYTGDPQASLQLNVYPANKPLDKIYYSNVNPEEYADMQNLLASAVHTPLSGDTTETTGEYLLQVRLPVELGQKIYEETINNPSSFANQDAFNQFFPGIYVTTGYGSGCILEIQQTGMSIAYDYMLKSSSGALDSVVTTYEHFIATKEIIQLNRMDSYNDEQLLTENDDYTYLKTPAGIYTRLVVPTKDIKEIADGRMYNSLYLNLKYMPQEEWMYSLAPSPQLLLIPEDSLDVFFKENYTENNINSYLSVNSPSYTPTTTTSGYNTTTRTYYFNNIINMISYHIQKNPDEDLRLLVIPIYREATSNSYYSTTTYYTTSISNYFQPSGVKLRKDEESMKVVLQSSKYANK